MWPQCPSVGWTPVRPGIKEGQRYAVNTTPNIHFPVLQAELFWERGEGLINSFYFSILAFLSTILPQLFALPLHPLDGQHPTDASQDFHICLGVLTDSINQKSARHGSFSEHPASQCTTKAISSGFCLCFSQIPINFKTD